MADEAYKPPQIELTPVKSSAFTHMGYDQASRTLRLTFKSGGTHDYHDVGEGRAAAMTGTDSIGTYFHKQIKPNYKSTKVG